MWNDLSFQLCLHLLPRQSDTCHIHPTISMILAPSQSWCYLKAFLSYVTFGYYWFVCISINLALLSPIAWDSVLLVWHWDQCFWCDIKFALVREPSYLHLQLQYLKPIFPTGNAPSLFFLKSCIQIRREGGIRDRKKRSSILICTLTSVWMGRSCQDGMVEGRVLCGQCVLWPQAFLSPLCMATSSLWAIDKLSFLGIAVLRRFFPATHYQKS